MIEQSAFARRLQAVCAKTSGLENLQLETLLDSVPDLTALRSEPFRSTVLLRFDLDVPIQDGRVVDLSRLEAGLPTIQYCLKKGWKVILLGHIGRDAAASAEPVYTALSSCLNLPITFIADWLDESNFRLTPGLLERIRSASAGSVFMLQNARKYKVEQALWTVKEEDFPRLSADLYKIARDFRENLTDTEINESIAASNTDFSSAALPLVMDQTAMGLFMAQEMKTFIPRVRRAKLVIFSGLKMDKLNDLEGLLSAQNLDSVIVAGALAMPLKKASADLAGEIFSAGRSESDSSLKSYIQPQRLEQAQRIVRICAEKKIRLTLPIDFILDDGTICKHIPQDRVQMDIGPASLALFQETVRAFRELAKRSSGGTAMFYNGVFGKFEDPRFENGTRNFIPLLKEMTDSGIETYVGGGEGRLALLKYGSIKDVTHAFTSGGTVLKCLANRHIGYVKAMYLQNCVL